jgi:outer membrane receptor protein involved in Fe transport
MIGYSGRRFTLRINGQLVSDYYAGNEHSNPISSYTVIDLYGESVVGSGARMFAGINNVFDETHAVYVDLPGGAAGLYEMPGITFIAGFKYTY